MRTSRGQKADEVRKEQQEEKKKYKKWKSRSEGNTSTNEFSPVSSTETEQEQPRAWGGRVPSSCGPAGRAGELGMTIWGPFGFGDPSVKTSKVPAGLPAAVE